MKNKKIVKIEYIELGEPKDGQNSMIKKEEKTLIFEGEEDMVTLDKEQTSDKTKLEEVPHSETNGSTGIYLSVMIDE